MTIEQRPEGWGPRGTAGVSFASALRFEDVTVRLGGRVVLDRLSLELAPGEVVCLLGESGSGKSTILRTAAGIQRIESGTVRINDDVVSGQGVHVQPDRRGIGLMFQDFALFPHLSLLRNVMFGLDRLDRKSAMAQARQALRRVGLADRESDHPHQLSGGQQQRLALARSIAPRPGILMLDEPFSSLDARMRESVRSETMAVLRETGATTLIVTHDPEEAMLLGDRVALMRNGRIVQIDSAAMVYDHPADLNAARFFSSLSEIGGRVQGGVVDTPLGIVPVRGHADGAEVTVGIRPVGVVDLDISGPGVPGRIVARRDAVGVALCEVRVDGLDAPVEVRRLADPRLKVGKDVFLRLRPEHVLVFAKD